MNHFMLYTTDNAPEASRPSLQQVKKAMGFVPNLFATFAESPAALEGYVALDSSLARSTLPGLDRQIVQIAVSTENVCAYCVAVHSTFARRLHAKPDVLEAVRTGAPIPDPKLEALATFTRLVMRHKGFISEADVTNLLMAGYTKAQLFEVVASIGLKTFHNYVNVLAQVPLDAAFEAQRWDAKQIQAA